MAKMWKRLCIAVIVAMVMALAIPIIPAGAIFTLYENFNSTVDDSFGLYTTAVLGAQTFTAVSNHSVNQVCLKLARDSEPAYSPGNFTVSIRATDASGHPTGPDLTAGTTDGDTLPAEPVTEWRCISFSTPCFLTAGTKYAIVLVASQGPPHHVLWRYDNAGGYAGGCMEKKTTDNPWNDYPSWDHMFDVYGSPLYDKFGVWRASTHTFFLDHNGNGSWDGTPTDKGGSFGLSADKPLVGKWSVDDKIGVWRNSTHTFLLDLNANVAWDSTPTDGRYPFGTSGDVPVIGNWHTADSSEEIGVWRDWKRVFLLDLNGNWKWDGSPTDGRYFFGMSGDTPLVGDWNTSHAGDEIGVWRDSKRVFLLDLNGNGKWDGAPPDGRYPFGMSGDTPIIGDWNGVGSDKFGVWRASTHTFFLDYNANGKWDGTPTDKKYTFGSSTDIPVIGNWNGDGKDQIGVWRDSNHTFLLDYNGNGVWNGTRGDARCPFGTSGDEPLIGDWE